MRTLAPETEYLGDLARAWANGVEGTVPPASELDRDRFLRLLSSQPALPTIARYVDPATLPPAEQPRLARAAEISRRRTALMLLELERVLPALAEVGCRPVVLKGASLALTVYDRPEDRWFIDLDLLVRPEQLEQVYDQLARLGYRFCEPRHAVRYYENYHFHRILMSNQGVCIEVHWAVTLPRSIHRYDVDQLRRLAREGPLGSAQIRSPHHIDQILHGVLQSLPCCFADLRRILDLHLLEAQLDEVAHDQLCRRAAEYYLETGLWLQYRLRELILGFDMPEAVATTCKPSPAVRRILERQDLAAHCLENRAPLFDGYVQMIEMLCTPRRLRGYVMRRQILPSEEMQLVAGLESGRPLSSPEMVLYVLRRWVAAGRMSGRLVRAAV